MAHIQAFQLGGLKDESSIHRMFDLAVNSLGADVLKQLHIHMYPADYDHNGEKKHKAFSDLSDVGNNTPYHPTAQDFVAVASQMELDTVVICEARDTQDVGSILMKKLFCGDGL